MARQSTSALGKTQKAVSFPGGEVPSKGKNAALSSPQPVMLAAAGQTDDAIRAEEAVAEQKEVEKTRPSASPAPGAREPAMMIVEFAYLSELPSPGWLDQLGDKPGYLLDVHVGLAARADPPQTPGLRKSEAVHPQAPGGYNPEEEVLHAQVEESIVELLAASGAQVRKQLECRYHSRVPIRLSDCGPGPGKGGPPYFRVDVWTETRAPLQKKAKQSLFGRAFVPINDPKLQKRFCTWPVVDKAGKEVAYLTCSYSFAHVPLQVESLKVEEVTSTKAVLAWKPPRWVDDRLPILGYRVEARALHRRQSFDNGSALQPAWELVANVEPRGPFRVVASGLRGDTRHGFRAYAVNEAGPGEPTETDATTSPTAPCACGPPRLGVCTGNVLTVEWEPPKDDGGMPIVSYWVMIRPADANAGPADWSDVGAVKPKDGHLQRADIHCDRLNPSVAEYVCSVAAENAANQYGPPTPDAALLRLPNPCAAALPLQPAIPSRPQMPDWSQVAAVNIDAADPMGGLQEFTPPPVPPQGAPMENFIAFAGLPPPAGINNAASHHEPQRMDHFMGYPGQGTTNAAGLYGPPENHFHRGGKPPLHNGMATTNGAGHYGAPIDQFNGFHGPPPVAAGMTTAAATGQYGPQVPSPMGTYGGPLVHEMAAVNQMQCQPGSHGVTGQMPVGLPPRTPAPHDPMDGTTVHRLIDLHGRVAYGMEAHSPGVSEKPSFVAAGMLAQAAPEQHQLYGAGFVPHHGSCLDAEGGMQRLIDLADRVACGMDIGAPPAYELGPHVRGDLYSAGFEPGYGAYLDAEGQLEVPMLELHEPTLEESRVALQQQLEEKRHLLSMSLVKCKQAAADINEAPKDAQLKAALEAAEIDAASYQAEVAVICQRLKELDA